MPLVDKPDTELGEKARLNTARMRVYDPPADGATPLDGAGLPLSSTIFERDLQAKLAQGFTLEPVGSAPAEEPEVEEVHEKPVKKAAVRAKKK